MDDNSEILLEKRKTLLKKAIIAIQDRGWLVWNPSQHGKNTIFDIASVPPKGGDSDEWDDDKTMVYKAITEENLNMIGLCLEEVKHYTALPVFVVENKDMAMKITELMKNSEDKNWVLMIPGEPAEREEKVKIRKSIAGILAPFRKLVHGDKGSIKN